MSTTTFNPTKYAQSPDVKGPVSLLPEKKNNLFLTNLQMWDIEHDIPDLTGKVALVTGANSPVGIGFHTAHQLAVHGATVYIGARSASKASSAIASMLTLTPSLSPSLLRPFVADLGDLKSVKSAAEKLMREETRLDIIVNNAGLLARPLDKDAHGISLSMVTNHLAPFVLTTTLLPLLKRTAASHQGVRVVMLSSYTHEVPPTGTRFRSLEDINASFGGTDDFNSNYARYGLAKLANLLFAKRLNSIFVAHGIAAIALAVHPGGVKTMGAIAFVGPNGHELLEGAMEPVDGAVTSLFAATRPEVWEQRDVYGGAYLMPFGVVVEPSENARDTRLSEELWKTSEELVDRVLLSESN